MEVFRSKHQETYLKKIRVVRTVMRIVRRCFVRAGAAFESKTNEHRKGTETICFTRVKCGAQLTTWSIETIIMVHSNILPT